MTTPCRMLRLPQVIQLTGLGRDSIYRLGRDGDFPQARKLTKHSSAWREDEIREWIESRPVSDTPSPNPAAHPTEVSAAHTQSHQRAKTPKPGKKQRRRAAS